MSASVALVLVLSSLEGAPAPETSPPTFCVEWVRQSREGYERLTLFADRTLVRKVSRSGNDELRRRQIPAEETSFYCEFFARPEFWSPASDLRTGLSGEFTTQSLVTLVRPDGSRRQLRFDELSALTPDAARLRSALEGLRSSFDNPLAPASRFTPDLLPPGTLLKRFDGVVFRVRTLERDKGVVELEGVRQPYLEFRKIEELRFQFSPPE